MSRLVVNDKRPPSTSLNLLHYIIQYYDSTTTRHSKPHHYRLTSGRCRNTVVLVQPWRQDMTTTATRTAFVVSSPLPPVFVFPTTAIRTHSNNSVEENRIVNLLFRENIIDSRGAVYAAIQQQQKQKDNKNRHQKTVKK